MTSPSDRIEQIRQRAEKATEGRWVFDETNIGYDYHGGYFGIYSEPDPESILARRTVVKVSTERPMDADFVAHSREDIPWLLSQLDRMREALKPFAEQAQFHEESPTGAQCDNCGEIIPCMFVVAKELLNDLQKGGGDDK